MGDVCHVALIAGQTTGVEEKLQAAEKAFAPLQNADPDDKTRDLIGQIAAVEPCWRSPATSRKP